MRSAFRSLSTVARLAAATAAVAVIAVPAATSSAGGYPPATPTLSADPGTVVVSTEFDAVGGGFTAGPVTVVIEGTDISVDTTAVEAIAFVASGTPVGAGFTVLMPAPATPGSYTVTATDSVGATASAPLTVIEAGTQPPPAGELPKTGSGNANLIAVGAAGLLGVGVLVVAVSRRRAAT